VLGLWGFRGDDAGSRPEIVVVAQSYHILMTDLSDPNLVYNDLRGMVHIRCELGHQEACPEAVYLLHMSRSRHFCRVCDAIGALIEAGTPPEPEKPRFLYMDEMALVPSSIYEQVIKGFTK
jgi:hypothetical protein